MSVTNIADACVILFLFGLVVVVGAFLEEAANEHIERLVEEKKKRDASIRRDVAEWKAIRNQESGKAGQENTRNDEQQ